MIPYPKINSLFKRDERGKIIYGQWATPEIEYLKDCMWTFTEKVNGSNGIVDWDGVTVRFFGRTERAQLPEPLATQMCEHFTPERFNAAGIQQCIIYGEQYGNKIQSGGKYRPDQSFVIFDVVIDGFWLSRANVANVAATLQSEVVPDLGYGTLYDAIDIVRGYGFSSFGYGYENAQPLKSQWGDFTCEGLVCRPSVPLFDKFNRPIFCKVKHKDISAGIGH